MLGIDDHEDSVFGTSSRIRLRQFWQLIHFHMYGMIITDPWFIQLVTYFLAWWKLQGCYMCYGPAGHLIQCWCCTTLLCALQFGHTAQAAPSVYRHYYNQQLKNKQRHRPTKVQENNLQLKSLYQNLYHFSFSVLLPEWVRYHHGDLYVPWILMYRWERIVMNQRQHKSWCWCSFGNFFGGQKKNSYP